MRKELYDYPQGTETRWYTAENPDGSRSGGGSANGGRKGSPCISLQNGESRTLAEVRDRSGVLRRIWMALPGYDTAETLNGLILSLYWEEEPRPAVALPVGSFFMHTPGRCVPFDTDAFGSAEGRTFLCYLPMPFRTGARVVLTNNTGGTLNTVFYELDFTFGDAIGSSALYFHALRTVRRAERFEDTELLPELTGSGRFIGICLTVTPNPAMPGWWGEGEVKGYLDGEKTPTLCGTGSEDYFGASWGLSEFAGRHNGCLKNEESLSSMYRFHFPDPVLFSRSFRLTIQSLGILWEGMREQFREAGTTEIFKAGERDRLIGDADIPCLYEREGDCFDATCYFYLDRP
ncbi:MAG: DUF2961 domain-containing protein [Clostridia bacterium]|nr:DUF2961 domain-containing protein [Clostridia bacterium]